MKDQSFVNASLHHSSLYAVYTDIIFKLTEISQNVIIISLKAYGKKVIKISLRKLDKKFQDVNLNIYIKIFVCGLWSFDFFSQIHIFKYHINQIIIQTPKSSHIHFINPEIKTIFISSIKNFHKKEKERSLGNGHEPI